MEDWMIILREIIRWVSIIACVVSPIWIIKNGCIAYLAKKQDAAIAQKDNDMLWANWERDKELERKKEWENYLSTNKVKEEVSTEENPEVQHLKKENENLKTQKDQLSRDLDKEIKVAKAVMLFNKLAAEKDQVTSQKIEQAMIEIDNAYDVIKKKIIN